MQKFAVLVVVSELTCFFFVLFFCIEADCRYIIKLQKFKSMSQQNKDPMLYVVVEFINEKSLAVVAGNWVHEDSNSAFWPPYKDERKCQYAAKIGKSLRETGHLILLKNGIELV